ncbi:MAG TPA: secretin N-terminal domain-containing protein, partial [Pirellulales bacterium]
MNFWRLLLLAMFCAIGIGLALYVVSSAPVPSAAATAAVTGEAKQPATATDRSDSSIKSAASTVGTTTLDVIDSAQPEVEHSNPRIAGQANQKDVLLAQTNPPANDRSLSVSPTDLMNAAKMLEQSKLLDALQGASSGQSSSGPSSTQAAPVSGTAPPMSQSDVMQKLREQLQRALQMKQSAGGAEQLPSQQEPSFAGPSNETPPITGTPAAGPPKSKPRIVKMPGEGDNNLSIHIQDSDLRDVLELLSEQGDLNILPSPSVQGKVSASLTGVNIDGALNAILRSTGFISKRDGNFIYVGTPQDFKTMAQSIDSVGTRVYHLNYIRAADVQALIQPLLTPGIGTSSVTQPANEGIAADGDKAGGNQYANADAVVVHDYVAVLNQVDQVIAEVDRKPAQVAIDAMILKVTLDDKYEFGVDLAFLRNNPNVRLFTGSPLSSLAGAVPNGGLSFAYLDSSTAA